ncbi:UDP-3-O-(3-hydroxymyristoyl)glucosamine N-acyltransferase [Defluviimonas sp. WL0050]|uniref:UDP-3-O-(3-hydroxymyristoyl)glucosamine N-acyltransferase n=1 Tax=Albidovulum litorale TaxID=2984134 RepID=A0ABT2ZPC3_9RHOB|nr:UDP-3-O-(3-hydroxymyristoyl)glucosamine N-acyltransferase [Defluviimonas sp. WL0050]MCV2873006.1 UDP-3-O-(3-hydroxymyristoyl)glucosamine N-acyltransferase [Defluviimonas sp. WL0050]
MQQSFSVAEIAEALGAPAEGDLDLRIYGAAEPATAGPDHLALAMDPKYASGLAQGKARVAVLWQDADWRALGLKAAIFVARPRVAMSVITKRLDPGPAIAPGIHPTAIVGAGASIGEGAAIGPYTVIGESVEIGMGARIAGQVTIGADSRIGVNALIHSGARIGRNVRIGDRFICQPGAVIGGDGFSYVTPEKSGAEEVREKLGQQTEIRKQKWSRIHTLGGVEIGDDVEIGSNATIDAGTIRATVIGNGTKLDNLVHLGHNVVVGEDCLLCGQTGIAGSVKIGDRVILGGQCGVVDNIFIGDDVIAGGGTKILSNAPAGRVLLGYPAIKMETHVQAWKNIRRLGRLFEQVAELREAVTRLGQTGRKDVEDDGER